MKLFRKGASGEVKQKKIKEPRNKAPKKKQNREIAFSRQKVRRNVSVVLFVLIALSLLFNVIFFTKYQAIRNSVKAQQEAVTKQLDRVKDADALNSDSVVVFTESFLYNYFYIPSDPEKRKERLDDLATYFVVGFDVSQLADLNDFKGSRKLTNMKYVEVERLDKTRANVHFRVDYEVKQEQEAEEPKGKDKKPRQPEPKTIKNNVEIIVPIVTDGEGFAVRDNPSIIKRGLKASIEVEPEELEGEELSSAQKSDMKETLEDFFKAYGTSDEKLQYMSKIENGLNDQIFNGMTINDAVIAKNDEYHLNVSVRYQDRETNLTNNFTYGLVVKKQQDNYFIEKINQGGF